MQTMRMTRRQLLQWLGAGSGAVVLAACAPAPGGLPAPSASEAGQTQAGQPAAATIHMSVATYANPDEDWQRHWSKQWAEENPDVDLQIDEVVYAEMDKKQLSMAATGTLWDVIFSGIKWYPYSAAKGVFAVLDDLVAESKINMDDFFSAGREGAKFEGKYYGLPFRMHPGNNALIVYNKTYLAKKGLPLPQDDWTTAQYGELATSASDPNNKIYGTNYFTANYYDFAALARCYGGDLLSADAKQFTLATDPKTVEATRWLVDLRAKYHAAPLRAESEGLQFAAGTYATSGLGIYAVRSIGETVADKFEYDFSLHPTGPDGMRGQCGFASFFSVAATSKHPEPRLQPSRYANLHKSGGVDGCQF